MDKIEHKKILDSLLTAEESERVELLARLESDYSEILTNLNESESKAKTLEESNAKYAELNNKLFLQIGVQNDNNSKNDNVNDINENEKPNKISYDSLDYD